MPKIIFSLIRSIISYEGHCVKSVQIWSFFWSIFSCINSEYRKIRARKNSVSGHFSRSGINFEWLDGPIRSYTNHSWTNTHTRIFSFLYWPSIYFSRKIRLPIRKFVHHCIQTVITKSYVFLILIWKSILFTSIWTFNLKIRKSHSKSCKKSYNRFRLGE